MKKNNKKHEPDFTSHAKKTMGEARYSKAVKKGQDKVHALRLKMAREFIGLNQSELKGLAQSEVSKIEGRKDLKISTLDKYAKAMGMRVKISLVSDDDELPIAIYG